jgi:hypothetical protein
VRPFVVDGLSLERRVAAARLARGLVGRDDRADGSSASGMEQGVTEALGQIDALLSE